MQFSNTVEQINENATVGMDSFFFRGFSLQVLGRPAGAAWSTQYKNGRAAGIIQWTNKVILYFCDPPLAMHIDLQCIQQNTIQLEKQQICSKKRLD
jgi:hypothetical protein